MFVRIVLLTVCAGLVYTATQYDRVFGFAAISALLTLLLYMPLEMRRYRIERLFFTGRSGIDIGWSFIGFVVLVNGLARAGIVGAAALFTFPSPDLTAVFDADYSAQLSRDAQWTFYLFGGAVAAAVVLSWLLDLVTNARGHRWSLFRMAAIYGVIFSFGAFMVQKTTQDSEAPVFSAPKGEIVLKALKEGAEVGADVCHTFAVPAPDSPDGVERPSARTKFVERSIWRANGCGAQLTPKFCESLKQPDGTFSRYSFKRTTWKDHGCDGLKTEVSFGQLMSVVTIIDDFIDQSLVNSAKRVIGDRGPLTSLLSALLAIFVSSNLIQGVVISTYAALILSLTRKMDYVDTIEDAQI